MARTPAHVTYEVFARPEEFQDAEVSAQTVVYWLVEWADFLRSVFAEPLHLQFSALPDRRLPEPSTETVPVAVVDMRGSPDGELASPTELLRRVLAEIDRGALSQYHRQPPIPVPRLAGGRSVDDPEVAFMQPDELVLTLTFDPKRCHGPDCFHLADERIGELLSGIADIVDTHAGPTTGRWILRPAADA